MLPGQYICRLELYPAEYESGSVFEVIGQVDLFVWIQRSGNSYFAGRFLYGKLPAKYRSLFTSTKSAVDGRMNCPILELLCRVLCSRPELSHEPLQPPEMGKADLCSHGRAPTQAQELRLRAFVRSLRVDPDLLEARLRIVKTPNPENQGICTRFNSVRATAKRNAGEFRSPSRETCA